MIFSVYGAIKKCDLIRDWKTGQSLQYAFIEFETKQACEEAFYKMDNSLVDARRIHVDFSQSVSKLWNKFRRRGNNQDQSQQETSGIVLKKKYTPSQHNLIVEQKDKYSHKNPDQDRIHKPRHEPKKDRKEPERNEAKKKRLVSSSSSSGRSSSSSKASSSSSVKRRKNKKTKKRSRSRDRR